jgi:hypothetical protein
VSAALHTVHLRVNDAATGQPTPVRLRITDSGGVYYAPLGRLSHFALGPNDDVGGNVLIDGLPYAYIDGDCEIRLPAGTLLIEISKGPEYRALRREVTLGSGQMALRFAIERWINLREEGWYSGDTRAEFITPHAALLEGAAEDLGVVNLLACSTTSVSRIPAASEAQGPAASCFCHHPAISNILAFSGQRPALEKAGHMVVVNTRNSHPVLGSLGLLNCHRPVYPLGFGGTDGLDNWSLADWCDQCHRKGGLVIGVKVWRRDTGFTRCEILADLVLGKVDALEIEPTENELSDALADWYGLLNCGLRVSLVAGSGKDSNQVVLGSMRTYARIQPGAEFTYKNWIEAVRAGRTFITNGPLLSFTVNGQDPGATVTLPPTTSTVRVRAHARNMVPFEELQLLAHGAVIARTAASGSPASALLEIDVSCQESGWMAARCRGELQPSARSAELPVFAHSAPIYLEVEGRPRPPDAAGISKLFGHLDEGLAWVQREGRFEDDHQRENLTGIFRAARAELTRRQEYP